MKSKSFGVYCAIHTLIVTAVLAVAVAAQGNWRVVPTSPEILEDNRRTGETAIVEKNRAGGERITRTSYFSGTNNPRIIRNVETVNGTSTIISRSLNYGGQTISYTEEVIIGAITYAESKDDLNWQGKQIQGTRWFFPDAGDDEILGEKMEQDLNPTTLKWETTPGKQPVKVHVFYHASRLADAKKAQAILSRSGYNVTLEVFSVIDGQQTVARVIFYYPATVAADTSIISNLLRGIDNLDGRQELRYEDVDDKTERSVTLHLMDKTLLEKPAPSAAAPNGGSNPKNGSANSAGNSEAMQENPARDQIAAALERNYTNTKKQVDRPQYDNNEATRLLNEMEAVLAYAEQQMLKEVPRSPRWQRFKDIKDRAESDIRMLKERLNMKPTAAAKEGNIRWGDTPDSLKLSDKIGKRFTFTCPSFSGGIAGGSAIIFGAGPFTGSSGICESAQYDGLVTTAEGGKVTIEIGPVAARYLGTTGPEDGPSYVKNNVQTFAWPNKLFEGFPAPKCSFTFVK